MDTIIIDDIPYTYWQPINAENYDRNAPRPLLEYFAPSKSILDEVYGSVSKGNVERIDYGIRRYENVIMPLSMHHQGHKGINYVVIVKKAGVVQYWLSDYSMVKLSNYKVENDEMRFKWENVYDLDIILRRRKLLALIGIE